MITHKGITGLMIAVVGVSAFLLLAPREGSSEPSALEKKNRHKVKKPSMVKLMDGFR